MSTNKKGNLINSVLLIVKVGFFLIFSFIFKWVFLRKSTHNCFFKRGNTILFTSETIEWRRIFDLNCNKYIQGDQFFNTLLNCLTNIRINTIFGTYALAYRLRDYLIFYEKRNAQKFNFLPLELFLDLKIFLKFIQENSIKIDDLKSLNRDYYSYIYEKLLEKLLETVAPDIILIEEEYGFFEKQLIVAGKKRNIPTIALQHGNIFQTHPYYITKDLSAREYFPDITCLYGESDRELLLNHSVYTSDDLVVTGSPRNDIIYHADRIYSRDKFCMNYNIPANHKIILWTTQSHGMTDEENTRQLDIVFGCCDNIPGITLVIKQHPGEKKRHYRMIQSYCRNHSCNTLMLPKDSDTFEALYVSDLVITYNSTTGREAAAFKKPLVVLDTQDSVGYSSEGVGVIVSSIQEAKQVISRLLKDDGELAVNREEYIKRYFYAIDGKSTERVVQLIEKVLSDQVKPVTL